MFEVLDEITELPNMTLIRGRYKNRDFSMQYYLNHEYKIIGEYTDAEQENLIKAYLNQL